MVKVNSPIGVIKGRAGNMSFFEVNGEVIGRSFPSQYKNPKTPAQMRQRIKMNNILNMYKYIKGYLKQNFEGIIGNKNASSFFRSYNLMKTPVWLTKEQKESYKFVLAPYVVSQGRITSVGYEYKDSAFISDISVGDIAINDETEENLLASAICANNEGWSNNDTLQIILLKQKSALSKNNDIDHPMCFSFVITLDKSSRTRVCDIPALETLSHLSRISLCAIDGKLAIKVSDTKEYSYAFSIVHSRGEGREKINSSQQLCLSDTSLYESYCSNETFDKSLESYK